MSLLLLASLFTLASPVHAVETQPILSLTVSQKSAADPRKLSTRVCKIYKDHKTIGTPEAPGPSVAVGVNLASVPDLIRKAAVEGKLKSVDVASEDLARQYEYVAYLVGPNGQVSGVPLSLKKKVSTNPTPEFVLTGTAAEQLVEIIKNACR